MTYLERVARFSIGGIRIVTSPYMAIPGGRLLYPDWRERLARNLGRPSTGKWEPLDYPDPRPHSYLGPELHGWRDLVVHPVRFAAIKNLGFVEGSTL